GLLEEVGGARLHRGNRARDAALPAQDQDLGLRRPGLEPPYQFHAVEVGQDEVDDGGIGQPGREPLVRLVAAVGDADVVAGARQGEREPVCRFDLVIDDEDAPGSLSAHGVVRGEGQRLSRGDSDCSMTDAYRYSARPMPFESMHGARRRVFPGHLPTPPGGPPWVPAGRSPYNSPMSDRQVPPRVTPIRPLLSPDPPREAERMVCE